jgi:hypothetical protein
MKAPALFVAAVVAAAALTGVLAGARPAESATIGTIAVDLALGDAVTLDAAVNVEQLTSSAGAVSVTGTIGGTATILGTSATIAAQPFTLSATTTCKAGMGTLQVTTGPISASKNGTPITIAGATLRVAATCGRSPTLDVAAGAVSATAGGTKVSTTPCAITITAPARSTVGTAVCSLQNVICQLNEVLAAPNPSATDIIGLLNQAIAKLNAAATV